MTTDPLKILQVSTALQSGGAEQVARDIHGGLLDRGHTAVLAVGWANDEVPESVEIPRLATSGVEARLRRQVMGALEGKAQRSAAARRAWWIVASPGGVRRRLDRLRGREAFEYPGSRALQDIIPFRPDVIHIHNVHGGYFDLRTLPRLSAIAPLMITLHDEWMFTGHCAYTMGCERWRTGCGSCPDLTIYPSLRRDGTATNQRIKRSIYGKSTYNVSAPSTWLIDRARTSILTDGASDFRVIRNGVDRSVFNSRDRDTARTKLGIPDGSSVLFFAANLTRSNRFKDHETVISAARKLGEKADGRRLIMISMGEAGPMQRHGSSEFRHLAFEVDRQRLADYYRAADLYLHAAHSDNAPLTLGEALACGTPVVATAVGGIPEMVRSLEAVSGAWDGPAVPIGTATGVLTPPRDADAMAAAAADLLAAPGTLAQLSENAALDGAARFDLNRQIDETLRWYREAVCSSDARVPPEPESPSPDSR